MFCADVDLDVLLGDGLHGLAAGGIFKHISMFSDFEACFMVAQYELSQHATVSRVRNGPIAGGFVGSPPCRPRRAARGAGPR